MNFPPSPLDLLPAPPPFPPLPWGLVRDDESANAPQKPLAVNRPGCTAADCGIQTLGYLEGLARGNGGFGVLHIGKEKLEEGARAAEHLGKTEIAQQYREVAQELPNIRDQRQAAAVANRLRPVVDEAWHLGRTCKGDISPQQLARARELARQVKAGKLSMQQAVEQLRKGEVESATTIL